MAEKGAIAVPGAPCSTRGHIRIHRKIRRSPQQYHYWPGGHSGKCFSSNSLGDIGHWCLTVNCYRFYNIYVHIWIYVYIYRYINIYGMPPRTTLLVFFGSNLQLLCTLEGHRKRVSEAICIFSFFFCSPSPTLPLPSWDSRFKAQKINTSWIQGCWIQGSRSWETLLESRYKASRWGFKKNDLSLESGILTPERGMDSRRISQNLESWEIQTVFLGPWILSLESWIQVLRALQGTEKCKFLQRAAWRTEQAYYDAPCQDVPFSHFQWQFYQFYLMKCDMVYVKKHCLFLVLVLFFFSTILLSF